jgi:peptide/nickel transport system substrate-binding protein
MRNSIGRGLLTGIGLLAVLCAAAALPGNAARATAMGSHASIKTGGTVNITYGPHGSFTRNFNPLTGNPADGTTAFIYEPLLLFNQLTGKVTPWLAKSYKWSNGNRTLTFSLRPGVKWNDGKPFTSADVKFSITLAKNPAIACGGCWTVISNITTPNTTTVVINFKSVNTSMLYYLGQTLYQVPQHVFAKAGDPTKFTNPNPVGTGPFKLGSFTPQTYTFVKNQYFWQKGKPYVSSLRFPAFTGNDAAQLAIVKGDIDWAGVLIQNAQSVYASKSPDNKFWYAGVGGMVGLCLNNAQAPFNNVHVRRAVSYALDRQTISKIAENNYAPPANQAFVQPQFVKTWGNTSAIKSFPMTADITKAKAELAKAGKVNYSAPLKLNVVSGFSDWQTGAQLMQSELKAAGFDVTVQALQYGAYFADLQNGKYDMSFCGTPNGPSPFYLFRDFFTSTLGAPIGSPAPSNFVRYKNTKLDSLLASYTRTTSTSQQVSLMKQAEAIVAADVPMVPAFTGAYWDDYSTKHFTGWPSKSNPYDFGAPYQNPFNEDVILHVHLK